MAVSVLVPEPAVRIIIHPGFQELIINFYIIYDVPAISQLFLFTGKMPQFLKMDQVVAGMWLCWFRNRQIGILNNIIHLRFLHFQNRTRQ